MKTNIIKNSQIYLMLKKAGKQITLNAITELDRLVNHKIEDLFEHINQTSPSVKRINTSILHNGFKSVITEKKKEDENDCKCKRCGGIKKVFIDLARQIQEYTIDEAKIALTSLEKGEKYVK